VTEEKNKRKCKVCGKGISREDSEEFDDMCWEYRDEQLTDESYSGFDELMKKQLFFSKFGCAMSYYWGLW
jgi:hypothetical protein